MRNMQQKTYSIGETARICGVTEKQIRHWEEKKHIPSPQRVICGQRSYRQFTEVDFNLISKIRVYLDEGYTLSTAAKKAAEEISTGKEGNRNG
jgi:DNA-binding transcriptional MerR regulator